MIAGIKRGKMDLEKDAVSILEKTLKASTQPNGETDLMGEPELNLKPILMENQEPGLVGKLKLSTFPAFNKTPELAMVGKVNKTASFVEKAIADSTVAEIDTDKAPAELSDEEPLTLEPTDAATTASESIANKPTGAKIGRVPPAVVEAADDPNDADGDDNRDDNSFAKKMNVACAFLLFWLFNAIICLAAYELAQFSETALRAIFESKPNYYPMVMVLGEKWSIYHDTNMGATRKTFLARRVTIVQTDTEHCDGFDECVQLLADLERNEGKLPYNFLISSSGKIFEARGWHGPSPMFPEIPTMVVAFIGDYDKVEPSTEQINQLKTLLSTSVHIKCLDSSYKINGRKIKNLPTKLFQILKGWKEYDYSNSDSEYVSVDFDPQILDKD